MFPYRTEFVFPKWKTRGGAAVRRCGGVEYTTDDATAAAERGSIDLQFALPIQLLV